MPIQAAPSHSGVRTSAEGAHQQIRRGGKACAHLQEGVPELWQGDVLNVGMRIGDPQE